MIIRCICCKLIPCISESCIKMKISSNFYFQTFLWCLWRFYEGLYKTIWGTTKNCENKNLIFILIQFSEMQGQKNLPFSNYIKHFKEKKRESRREKNWRKRKDMFEKAFSKLNRKYDISKILWEHTFHFAKSRSCIYYEHPT